MKLFAKWRHRLKRALYIAHNFDRVLKEIDDAKHLAAEILIRDNGRLTQVKDLCEVEFSVHSQWGDDGIIQYLLTQATLLPSERTFIEIGTQDYRESNTRFLLERNRWKGILYEADPVAVASIRRDELSWRHDLQCVEAFITRENINGLLSRSGPCDTIGLLSIDIDGNDYWIWNEITVFPPIVIVECNQLFGGKRAVSVPYDPSFVRRTAHFSMTYFGASLKALSRVASRKGYALVGTNAAGNNAYFVRKDRCGSLRECSAEEAFRTLSFREERDQKGGLTLRTPQDMLRTISHLPLVDVETGKTILIEELLRAGDAP